MFHRYSCPQLRLAEQTSRGRAIYIRYGGSDGLPVWVFILKNSSVGTGVSGVGPDKFRTFGFSTGPAILSWDCAPALCRGCAI